MIKNIISLVGSLVFTVLLCEGILQLLDYPPDTFSPWIASKSTGFRMAPNIHQRMTSPEYNIDVQTNSYGLRDDPVKRKEGFRILVLGDSFAFGYGVEKGETFSDILEHRLQTEVVNAGIGGFEIIHQVRWFREVGKTLNADLVVYALYLGNDLSNNTDWTDLPDGTLAHRQYTYPVRLNRSVKTLALIDNILLYKPPSASGREWAPYPAYLSMTQRKLSPEDEVKYSVAKRLLGELNAEVKKNGADLFVFMFPYKTVVDPEAQARFKATIDNFDKLYDLERPSKEMEDFLKKSGIPYFNSVGPMKQYYKTPSNGPLFYYTDGHFTAAGHAFVAALLEPILASRLDAKVTR